MIFDDAITHCETQSGALTHVLTRKKRVEHVAQMLRGNARAVVFELYPELRFMTALVTVIVLVSHDCGADANPATGRQSVQRIEK